MGLRLSRIFAYGQIAALAVQLTVGVLYVFGLPRTLVDAVIFWGAYAAVMLLGIGSDLLRRKERKNEGN